MIAEKLSIALLLCLLPFALAAQRSPFDTPVSDLFENGREFFEKKDYSAADRYFENFIEAGNPDENSEEMRMALHYIALSSFYLRQEDAKTKLEHYCKRYPYASDKDLAEMYIGVLEFEDGKYKQALKRFETVDKKNLDENERLELLFYKGYAYIRQSSWKAAAYEFGEILKLSDNKYYAPACYYHGFANYSLGEYAAAVQSLEKVENNSDFPDAPLLICLCLYGDGDCTAFMKKAGALIENGTAARYPELLRLMGICNFRAEDYGDALAYMGKYKESVKKMSREDWYISGISNYKSGNFQEAVNDLSKAVAKSDDDISQNSYFHIANAYLQLGDKDKARMSFEAAAKYKKDAKLGEAAMYNYAVLTYKSGFAPFDQTISAFEKFLAAYPQSEYKNKVYECLVNIYLTTNNYAAAYNSIQKIGSDDPVIKAAEERVLYGLATDAIANRQYAVASKNLKKILDEKKVYDKNINRKALFWYAECLYKSGKYSEALSYYKNYADQKGADKDKEYPMALYGIAYSYIRNNDYASASEWMRKFCGTRTAKEDKSLLVDAYNRIGDCNFHLRSYNEALKAYSSAYAVGTGYAGTDYALYQTALIAGLQKKYSDKIKSLQKLLDTYPDSDLTGEAMFEMAKAYMESGDNAGAIAMFGKICDKYKRANPIVRQARLQIAMLQYNSGDLASAVENFKLLVQVYPRSEEAATALSTLEIIMVDNNRVDEYNAIAKSAGKTSAVKEDSLSYKACERIYFKDDFAGAATNFEKYLKTYPQGKYSSLARYYLANCYWRTGNKKDALTVYKAIADDPSNPNLQLSLQRAADLSYEAGDYASSLQYFEQLRETADASGRQNAKAGILRCNYILNKYEATIAVADNIIAESNPSDEMVSEARYKRMKSYLALGQKDKAMPDIAVLATDTRSEHGAEAKYLLEASYAESGDYQRAEAEFFDFVEKGTSHAYWLAKAFLTVSDVYMAQGNYFEAKQYLQSLKDNYTGAESDISEGIAKRLELIEKHEKESVSE